VVFGSVHKQRSQFIECPLLELLAVRDALTNLLALLDGNRIRVVSPSFDYNGESDPMQVVFTPMALV
jgi:hypothetical protein